MQEKDISQEGPRVVITGSDNAYRGAFGTVTKNRGDICDVRLDLENEKRDCIFLTSDLDLAPGY